VIKSESNTKSCVQGITLGTTDRENAASIGPSRTGEKYFSRAWPLGFYASGHDKKMTGKRDFRADRVRNRARTQAGTNQGKIVGLCERSR
jgi:hypothetical protein